MFTIVAGISGLTVVGAVTRRLVGGGRRGHGAIEAHPGDTDPGRTAGVRQLALELDALREEVTGLRRELDEAQNRLDFTERLLGQARERGLLGGAAER